MKIINPATEETIQEITEYSSESIKQIFLKLKKGQLSWKQIPISERLNRIRIFSDLLGTNKDELAKILTSEMGKPLWQSLNEINGAQYRINFFLENSEKYLSDEWQILEGNTKEKISYEPLGIIANISAWNYPYLVGVNVFIPALIAGNSVLYKPSEYATLTGLKIEELLLKAGIPDNCFKAIAGGKNAGEALLDLPLDGYFFTGSFKTGKYIAEKVAPKLVPCQLELGGNDPLYVADDVESIKNVANSAVEGVFYNNGQSCCAVKRIYVHQKVYDEFICCFLEELKKWKVGNPMEDGVMIGPVARKEHLIFLEDLVSDALKKGAVLLCGGQRSPSSGKGWGFSPTVFSNVDHTMRLMKEETFGPVIGIQKVINDDEAAALMQDTEFGLTVSVYSKDKFRAEKILAGMNTGTAYWNCCDRVSPFLPWSGRKNSGIGATLSHLGIRAFAKPKGWHLRS